MMPYIRSHLPTDGSRTVEERPQFFEPERKSRLKRPPAGEPEALRKDEFRPRWWRGAGGENPIR